MLIKKQAFACFFFGDICLIWRVFALSNFPIWQEKKILMAKYIYRELMHYDVRRKINENAKIYCFDLWLGFMLRA